MQTLWPQTLRPPCVAAKDPNLNGAGTLAAAIPLNPLVRLEDGNTLYKQGKVSVCHGQSMQTQAAESTPMPHLPPHTRTQCLLPGVANEQVHTGSSQRNSQPTNNPAIHASSPPASQSISTQPAEVDLLHTTATLHPAS